MKRKQFRSFLVGTLLGDASFSGKKNKHILFAQVNKEYALWKMNVIKKNFPVGIIFKQAEGMEYGYGKKRKPMWRCWTTSHHKFTALYKKMCPCGIKTISEKILNYIDGLGLAVWFMDDGCKETSFKNGIRKIHSFKIALWGKKENAELVPIWLKRRFGIESVIFLQNGKYPMLRISRKESKEKFVQIIKKYIHPELEYKIKL